MFGKSISTHLGVTARVFARFVGNCGGLLAQSVQHAYDVHQERAQMRFAPTKPRSWHDVRRVRADCY
jgi:hypothetical protein